jgi:hypothetical protein
MAGKKSTAPTLVVGGENKENSPPKKKFKAPVAKVNSPVPTKQDNKPRLVCFGWSLPLRFELYMYEKSSSEDAYTFGIQKYLKGEYNDTHDPLDRANFVRTLSRRIPFSDNEQMKTKNGYRRVVFLRYPRGDAGSTKETRQDGLRALKSFVSDTRFAEYPPGQIELVDKTNEDNYQSLDTILLDNDIEELMKLDIPSEVLNENFRDEYSGFAESCWNGPYYSDFARSLGFGVDEKKDGTKK